MRIDNYKGISSFQSKKPSWELAVLITHHVEIYMTCGATVNESLLIIKMSNRGNSNEYAKDFNKRI